MSCGALVREHPLREQLTSSADARALSLRAAGGGARRYREARRVLVDELGIEPGRSLRELEQAILEQDPRLDLAAASDGRARGGVEGRVRRARGGAERTARRPRGCGRGPRPSVPRLRRARHRQEPAGRRVDARGRLPRCPHPHRPLLGGGWSAGLLAVGAGAAGVRAGDGARTAARPARHRRGRAGAASCPSCARCSPGCPSRPHWTRTGRGSACSTRPPSSCATHARLGRRCSSWTICTPPIRASLVLLRFLAREIGSMRLLVLGAYRDVDPVPGQPLSETLVEVIREPETRRLSLGGLSEREVMQYVESTAPTIASPELGAAVHEETEGNPLFVGETLRLLALEGIGRDSGGGLRLGIARNVRGRDRTTADSPLRGLQPRTAARVGSGQGVRARRARPAGRRLGGRAVGPASTRRSSAASCRTFRAAPVVCRFSHVLIRDTLYDGLANARRVRLHRRAAEALEDLYGDSLRVRETPERVLALARHWSGRRSRARDRLLPARSRTGAARVRQLRGRRGADACGRPPPPDAGESRRDEEELELTVMLGAARGWGSPDYVEGSRSLVKLGRAVSPPILRGWP